jgi:hypothetical protein
MIHKLSVILGGVLFALCIYYLILLYRSNRRPWNKRK